MVPRGRARAAITTVAWFGAGRRDAALACSTRVVLRDPMCRLPVPEWSRRVLADASVWVCR